MKSQHLIIAMAALLVLPACERSGNIPAKVKDKVNDALDRRPAEGVRDAVEDIGDSIEDAKKHPSKSLKEVTR